MNSRYGAGSGLGCDIGGTGVIPFFLSFSYLLFVNGDEGLRERSPTILPARLEAEGVIKFLS